nr:hypothetical protein [Tanacetum cinerariifolium]
KRDRDDEGLSAGPNQGKKTKRIKTNASEPSKKLSTTKELSKGKSPPKTFKSGKFVTAEELVKKPIIEMASNDIEQTIDDVVNDVDQPPDDMTQTKDKAPKYECDVELEYNMEETYKALSDQLDWNNPEGDCCPNDLSTPLPLKGHVGRLTVPLEYFFNNDLEYLKSSDPKKKYTTSITKIKAARYETLKLVRDELHHRAFNFCLGYNKEMSRRKWSDIDKRMSELMVKLIDNQMRERLIIRNLKRLVGAQD